MSAPVPVRCPSCGARLPDGTLWCLQCYEPIRTPSRPAPPAARGAEGPGDAERMAAELLLSLAADEGGPLVTPGRLVRRLAPLLATRGGRAGVTAGLTLAVSLLVFALMAVLGALLG